MARRKKITGSNVFDVAVGRVMDLYESGHRVVVASSGGKDSTVVTELAIIAAEATGNLPVDVVTRDEEINWPGTYEYLERLAERPEIRLTWLVAHQPIINVFDRANPYWWVFDPWEYPQEKWARPFPSGAVEITDQDIRNVVHPSRFPPTAGKKVYAVMGMRGSESVNRLMGVFSMKTYTASNPQVPGGSYAAWPIYDWTADDVWKAINDLHWDYNTVYDPLMRFGLKGEKLRVAPPTMSGASVPTLQIASRIWPQWFEKVCTRLPSVRTGAQFGLDAIRPMRRLGESWEATFWRECVSEAPGWIAGRARIVAAREVGRHSRHAVTPYPDSTACINCAANGRGSWRMLALGTFLGDPFSMRSCDGLPYVEPEFFRPSLAGTPYGKWGGKPG